MVERAKLLEKIPGSRNYTLHGHTLRKFFITRAKLSGCRADFTDFWVGHHPTAQSEYLNDSYFRADLKEHLTEYRKAVGSLSIFENVSNAKLEKETEQLKLQLENRDIRLSILEQSMQTILSTLQKSNRDHAEDIEQMLKAGQVKDALKATAQRVVNDAKNKN